MAHLEVAAQEIELLPVPGVDGLWHGSAQIADLMFHVEAYATDSVDERVVETIDGVYEIAPHDKPLATLEVDGRQTIVVFTPFTQ